MSMRLAKYFFVLMLFLLSVTAYAQNDEVKVPAEVKRFVIKGTVPIALETGDLNGDGRKDFVLVTSEIVPENAQFEEGAGARSVLILTRDASGVLGLAASNDIVVYCKVCGGVFGDPFAGASGCGNRDDERRGYRRGCDRR